MGKVLKTAGKFLLFGVTAYAAGKLLNKLVPKIPDINAGGQFSSPLDFVGDTNSGIPYLFGRTAFASRMIKKGSSGYIHADDPDNDKPNYLLHQICVHSLGPIEQFESFKADKTLVTFDGDGSASTVPPSPYDTFMWMRTQTGTAPYVAMTQPPGSLDNEGAWGGWDATHKLSSMAAAWWILAAENPPYESGAPTPLWILKGVHAYDPRLDSTQTGIGGSGPQRVADETTWTYTDNPALHALTFCLGRYRNGKRLIGLGAPPATLDIAAFANAANVADANGWTLGGVVFSTDSKEQVLKAMLQAGGAKVLQLGAKLSCTVNAPRVSLATITGADFIGVPQIAKTRTRSERKNIVIPSYRSEPHGWEVVAAQPIRVDSYVTLDRNEERPVEVTYTFAQDVDQAAQLGRYDLEDTREIGPIVAPLRSYLMDLKPGDCVTINEPEYRLINQPVVATNRTRDATTGAPTLTFVGETFAKHAAALATTGVAPPVPEET